MFVVHKYVLDCGVNGVEMPRNPKFLAVGQQDGVIVVWALVSTKANIETVQIDVVMTGDMAPSELEGYHIGTVTARSKVFHAFWMR